MFKISASLIILLICMQCINSFKYDDLFEDSNVQEAETEVDQEDANQFLKRLFHPFATKNEGFIKLLY